MYLTALRNYAKQLTAQALLDQYRIMPAHGQIQLHAQEGITAARADAMEATLTAQAPALKEKKGSARIQALQEHARDPRHAQTMNGEHAGDALRSAPGRHISMQAPFRMFGIRNISLLSGSCRALDSRTLEFISGLMFLTFKFLQNR